MNYPIIVPQKIVPQHQNWIFSEGMASFLFLSLLQSDHFPLIYCIEKLVYEHEYPQWESCFDKLGLESKPVLKCYTSGRGNEVIFVFL